MPAEPHPCCPVSILPRRGAPALAGSRDCGAILPRIPEWLDLLFRREEKLRPFPCANLVGLAKPPAHSENEVQRKATRCSRRNFPQEVARCAKNPARPFRGAPLLAFPTSHKRFLVDKEDQRRPAVVPTRGAVWTLPPPTVPRFPSPSPATAKCQAGPSPL